MEDAGTLKKDPWTHHRRQIVLLFDIYGTRTHTKHTNFHHNLCCLLPLTPLFLQTAPKPKTDGPYAIKPIVNIFFILRYSLQVLQRDLASLNPTNRSRHIGKCKVENPLPMKRKKHALFISSKIGQNRPESIQILSASDVSKWDPPCKYPDTLDTRMSHYTHPPPG